jgi:mycothiol synthase
MMESEVSRVIFRRFRGEIDYEAMCRVIERSKAEDGLERIETAQDIARNYRHLTNCDLDRDMLFAEVNGEVIGYSRVWWECEQEGNRLYKHLTFLLPDWRGQGIRRTMLRHNEHRLREIAALHPAGPRFFEAWAAGTETHWQNLLVDEGYEVVRYGFEMVRPDLDNIPDRPLPEGLEVRPVQPEHIPLIWQAAMEAFRDHWGYAEDEWIREIGSLTESPIYDPSLWQVAWDGDQVAGMVQNFIDEQENVAYNRKRGYTEGISVRRPWRRRGLARALIARSFHVLKDRAMTEAALGVDAQNPNGALQLYRSMGFCEVQRLMTYRKPLE